MKTTLVAYYSRTGSNQYLAQKVADALHCDIAPIRPRPGAFFWLIIMSWFNLGARPGLTKETLAQYDRIIICGPIWMGTLVAPLRGLLQQLKNSHQEICHITCCGSKDEKKDDTFGYGTVFPKVKKIVGERLILSEAFPIVLVLPENQREDDELIMNTRLSDENFHGEIQDRLDRFVNQLRQMDEPAMV
jgi:flavodoxin